jgi:hypothetical protein
MGVLIGRALVIQDDGSLVDAITVDTYAHPLEVARRMDRLVQSLGITGLSKSQVPMMARDLDELVRDLRKRPLGAGPYAFLAADALTMKVREGGRVTKIAVMVATGVIAEGLCDPRRLHQHQRVRVRLQHLLSRISCPADSSASRSSPAMPMPGWSRRSRRTCPARAGSAAGPTTPPT